MTTSDECTFCSNPATTDEHVIPKWLQRHYRLWDKQMMTWTGKLIHYRSAKVRACEQCNGVRFANLENRIRLQKASERDYYLWGLKVLYGLAIIDGRLYLDPKHPEKGFILPPDLAQYKKEFILPALASLENPNFKFEPDPFGSVFIFEQETDNEETFGFADVISPFWAFSITVPPNKVIALLFADRGVVKAVSNKTSYSSSLDELAKNVEETIPRQLLFCLLRLQSQLSIPSGIQKMDADCIISAKLPPVIATKLPELRVYDEICERLNISKVIGKVCFEKDLVSAFIGFVNWMD